MGETRQSTPRNHDRPFADGAPGTLLASSLPISSRHACLLTPSRWLSLISHSNRGFLMLQAPRSKARRGRHARALALAVALAASSAAAEDGHSFAVARTIAPLPQDPTEVYGLNWYEVGFAPSLVPETTGFSVGAPLTSGLTGIVALRFRIDAPASGTTWRAVFARPNGTQTVFEHTFTWYPTSMQGCLTGYINGRWEFTACGSAFDPSSLSFSVAEMLFGPCLPLGLYGVTLTGTEAGANFTGDFTLVGGGVAARLEVSAPTVQVDIPSDAASIAARGLPPAAAPYDLPAIPGGEVTLTLTARDQLCPNLPLKNVSGILSAAPVNDTGGHFHPATVALGPPFVPVTPGLTIIQLGASGPTDDAGKIQVRFIAGEASLTFRVDASLVTGSSVVSATPLTFQVQDLSTAYTVSGLSPLVGMTLIHPNNHYEAPGLDAAIAGLQANWRATALGDVCGSFGINDISLEHGGVFDVGESGAPGGNFLPPHALHRRGVEFDVSLPPSCNYGLPVPFTGETLRSLARRQIKALGVDANLAFFPEPTIHFRPF